MGDKPVTRPFLTYRTAKTRINTHKHPWFERDSNPQPQYSKPVHALKHVANVIGEVLL